jgi:hypothetical protein
MENVAEGGAIYYPIIVIYLTTTVRRLNRRKR